MTPGTMSEHHHKKMFPVIGFLLGALLIVSILLNVMLFLKLENAQTAIGMREDEDELVEDGEDEDECSAAEPCSGDFICDDGQCVAVPMEGTEETEGTEGEEFESIVVVEDEFTFGYRGVAVLEGYYVEAERGTTLLGLDGPTIKCAAFVITDGPAWAIAVTERYDSITLGTIEELNTGFGGMRWFGTPDITESSESSPAKAIFKIGGTFEGEVVGCNPGNIEYIGSIN